MIGGKLVNVIRRSVLITITALIFVCGANAQLDEICGESAGSAWLNSAIVYGKIRLNGFETGAKFPKITVTLSRIQRDYRITIDRSGNYCFRDVDGGGGTLVVDIEGVEVGRQVLPASGLIKQHRQDFEVYDLRTNVAKPPGTVSAKYSYPRSEKNAKLFEEAAAAEKVRDKENAIRLLKEIVTDDPADFLAWSKMGAVYFEHGDHLSATDAFKKALEAKPDLVPAMINLGRIYLLQKKIEDAIQIFNLAAVTDRNSANAFRMLGEAYLLDKKGTKGVAALNEAIRLDPKGMADCHLLMATLYDRAGAKPYASREYRLFLEKVPEHADKKKFEKYIKENPEETGQE